MYRRHPNAVSRAGSSPYAWSADRSEAERGAFDRSLTYFRPARPQASSPHASVKAFAVGFLDPFSPTRKVTGRSNVILECCQSANDSRGAGAQTRLRPVSLAR